MGVVQVEGVGGVKVVGLEPSVHCSGLIPYRSFIGRDHN